MVKRRTSLAEGSNPVESEVRELPDDGSIGEDADDVHRRQAPLLVRLNRS